jgi:hypothetical protein
MSCCKICKTENKEKKKVFICDSCKEELYKCPICGNKKSKIQYKTCQKCSFNDEYKNKMSKSCKGKPGHKWTDEEKEKISKANKGNKSWCKGLTKETSESLMNMSNKKKGDNNPTKRLDVRNKISKSKKGKPGHKWTEEQKKNASIKYKERLERGELGKNPKCNWFNYKGIKAQGRSELKWLKNNYDLIIKKKRSFISTPHGIYIPDFETNNYLIEIKSSWTYNILLQDKNKLDKLNFINLNIKPLKIIIDNGKNFEEINTSDIFKDISENN